MEFKSAGTGKQNNSVAARPLWKYGWWLAAAFVFIAVSVLLMYLLAGQLRPALSQPSNVIYDDPMWVRHASMHSMADDMMGAGSTHPAVDDTLAPIVEMKERFYDFGRLSGTREVSRSFVLANRGSAPLIVTHAYATCGCTSAEISASVIPPGKSGLVTVYFTPTQSTAGSAAVRRGIILETNDPQQPLIEIWVQAELDQ